KVKWFKRGGWFKQHDADFLETGNILLFDNIDMQEDPNRKRASRVVEINPANMAEEWVFRGHKDMRFRSAARGSQQRLPNGNTLITESHRGRLLEVSDAGEVVWEYRHDQRLGENDELIPVIMWAERYTRDQVQFALSD
ncbi:MAG: arylsulfotransferase family protein, partial [Gammaproteobacteria bacterium]|nr:arylsulfotransferase family protein [Gammaproteobacteria bacterium]